jgi:hypothetical protein
MITSIVLAATTGSLVSLLIWLLILAVVIWVVYLVVGMLPIPANVKNIICVILALIFLLVILQRLGFLA